MKYYITKAPAGYFAHQKDGQYPWSCVASGNWKDDAASAVKELELDRIKRIKHAEKMLVKLTEKYNLQMAEVNASLAALQGPMELVAE